MKFLVVVTPPSIYHGCFTHKTFWEGKFTGKKYLFQSVNMKKCGLYQLLSSSKANCEVYDEI